MTLLFLLIKDTRVFDKLVVCVAKITREGFGKQIKEQQLQRALPINCYQLFIMENIATERKRGNQLKLQCIYQ